MGLLGLMVRGPPEGGGSSTSLSTGGFGNGFTADGVGDWGACLTLADIDDWRVRGECGRGLLTPICGEEEGEIVLYGTRPICENKNHDVWKRVTHDRRLYSLSRFLTTLRNSSSKKSVFRWPDDI